MNAPRHSLSRRRSAGAKAAASKRSSSISNPQFNDRPLNRLINFYCAEAGVSWQDSPEIRPTFQHFDGHLGDPVWLLLVQSHGLTHHHLTKAAFAQRLPENQPAQNKCTKNQLSLRRKPAPGPSLRQKGGTCPGKAPSVGPEAAHTPTPPRASESRWRTGETGGPAWLQSGRKSLSQQTPEVKDTDITLLKVEHTPVNSFTQVKPAASFSRGDSLLRRPQLEKLSGGTVATP